MKRLRVQVFGKVQGVWFRKFTADTAQQIGITGWVKNLNDGSVQIEAQGTEPHLNQLLEWCKTGSPQSRVDKVNELEIPILKEEEFQILR